MEQSNFLTHALISPIKIIIVVFQLHPKVIFSEPLFRQVFQSEAN